jgi:hypothetical protein
MPHFECGAIDHSATSPVAASAAYLMHNREKWNPVSPEKSKLGECRGARVWLRGR